MNLLWNYKITIDGNEYSFENYQYDTHRVMMRITKHLVIIREIDKESDIERWKLAYPNSINEAEYTEIYAGKIINDLFFLDSLLRHLLHGIL